ncbi:MAG: metal-dependent hydrolase, partial [Lachnospiraceae bacterium]|nr:metal-dependent hydrolase [Lachnospiraceae bacterium]
MIIDFHTHTFPAKAAPRIIAQLTENGHIPHHTDGTPEGLAASMQAAGIGLSVNLPVMTRVDQVEHVNSSLIERYETLLSEGILTFGGLHPDIADPKAEIRRLKENGIHGVKLHPAYQQTDLNDIRYLRMIDALSEAGLITVVHAG